jgi:protein-disulfide isomerase
VAPQLKHYGFAAVLAVAALTLGAASCDRQSAVGSGDHEGAGRALERAETGESAGQQEPLPGVDLERLGAAETERFHALVDSLASPCGQAHSLRTSVLEDEACRRAVFAARYVAQLIGDGAGDIDVRQFYDERYREDTVHEFEHDDVPRSGPSDARVEIVEFLDYGCPHCKTFGAVIDRAQLAWPTDVAVYYRFFPLGGNPHGMVAAQSAVAAKRQGKFKEMHEALFRHQGRHDPESLRRYAAEIGLDMEKFEVDVVEAEARVERDRNRGQEIGVRATPTVFINGRRYTDPDRFEYVKLWIEEELAVN